MATLSLYRLDQELTDLLELREQILEDSLPGDADLTGVDAEIQAYMEQLPSKVDGVAHVLRHFTEQADFADREIKRLKARKAQIEENAQRLKDYAAAVIEKQPAPAKGCRKLVGQHSTLMLKGNGGVQPLVIAQPELVPEEYRLVIATFRADEYERLWPFMTIPGVMAVPIAKDVKPDNARIREVLMQPCERCDGGTDVLIDDVATGCIACGGTGRNAVPGAHLEPRGQHIEVK